MTFESMASMTTKHNPPAFVTTHWTRVLEASGDGPAARAALNDLCEAYYGPVEAFVRHRCRDVDKVSDLTQGFFAQLIEKDGLATVKQGRARFRSFLLGAVKHFLSDQLAREQAAKRGGHQVPLSIDAGTDTSPGLEISDPTGLAPEKVFDREWAITLLDRAMKQLADGFKSEGKTALFETLKPWLTGDGESVTQAEAAVLLKMTEGAIKVAIHRLRRRFRQIVKTEIAQTVSSPDEVQSEFQYLIEVLA